MPAKEERSQRQYGRDKEGECAPFGSRESCGERNCQFREKEEFERKKATHLNRLSQTTESMVVRTVRRHDLIRRRDVRAVLAPTEFGVRIDELSTGDEGESAR